MNELLAVCWDKIQSFLNEIDVHLIFNFQQSNY